MKSETIMRFGGAFFILVYFFYTYLRRLLSWGWQHSMTVDFLLYRHGRERH